MRPSSVVAAGRDDDAGRAARHDHRAGKGHVLAVADRRLGGDGIGRLLRRNGLAGQRRLLGAQVLGVDETQVGRDLVAGFEKHDVAGRRDPRPECSRVSPPRTRARLRRKHVADRVERLLRPALLHEAEQRIEDDDGEDDRGVEPQAQHQLDEAGGEQDIDEDVVELGEEPQQRPLLLALRQAVRPVGLQPRRGLGGVEAALRDRR